METPSSSTRRVTRSQTLALAASASNNNVPRKIEDSEKGVLKSRQQQQDRSALIDITNDSPIIGLATVGLETPSSGISKKRISRAKNNKTPGSGENLLRGQVKTLLQKVEEEAELSKLPLESRPFLHLQGTVNSPLRLLAPTPANTPQILNLSEDEIASIKVNPSPLAHLQSISQVVSNMIEGNKQESTESEKNMLTRSLLMDFSEKSEVSSKPSESPCADEDESSSEWSIQVNASAHDEEEEEEYCEFNCDEELVDELCEEMSKISVNNEKATGKHTRFIYNSDDEIIEEEYVENKEEDSEPKGKHLFFETEEEEEEEMVKSED
ncbi:uncharacterized protein LOC116126107 [Pistacia vera]|uniref:uncharacterized protein LOC116126107 n=1 Tax=Pistacia vera TaxID=55513 RepID=UPI00126384D7|nr:uncharacterized protein LOC116126107 [Pistacia vera]